MLLDFCIGKAAVSVKEFYILPVGEKLMQYDKLAVNTIVTTKDGDISTCDLPYSDDFEIFARDYMRLTQLVHDTSEAYDASEDHMVIGTSALTQTEIDGAILSSVVPGLDRVLSDAVQRVAGISPLLVGPGVKTGMNIRIDNPA